MRVNIIKASSLEELNSLTPSTQSQDFLALAFASVDINHTHLYELLATKGYTPITSSTSGQFTQGKIVDKGIIVLFLEAPKDSFRTKIFEYSDNFFEVGKEAGVFAKDAFEHGNALFIGNSDSDANHESILKGFLTGCENQVPIFGGLASRDLNNQENFDTFIGVDGKVTQRGVGIVVFDSTKVSLNGVVASGWTKIGTSKLITNSFGNRVYEIDHVPIKELYKLYFNFKEDTNISKYLEYPILLKRANGEKVIRAIVDVGENYIQYSGEIPEHSEIFFCSPNITEAVNKASNDINRFQKRKELMDSDAVIAFSCAARVISFGFYIQNELQAFNDMWRDKHVGLFSHGEIGKIGKSKCELHNNSISVVFFKDLTNDNQNTKLSKNLEYKEEQIEIFDFVDKDKIIMKFQEEKQVMSNLLQKTSNDLADAMAELDFYKNNLEKKVEEEIGKREEKEKLLLQQSKLAAMGEMIDAVAHQWRQPINIIGIKLNYLGIQFFEKKITQEFIEEFQQDINADLRHMSSTLEEFRTFFRPNKRQVPFDVSKMVKKVLLLIKDELIKYEITVSVDDKENFTLNGVENEFKHLILNIINNAKDAFEENSIKNREIQINIFPCKSYKTVEIIDNAGGIPQDLIQDIFKANVTSKEDGKGTGIGLYLSKQIAIKHNGSLSVENVEGGAKFTFKKRID